MVHVQNYLCILLVDPVDGFHEQNVCIDVLGLSIDLDDSDKDENNRLD